MLAERYFPFQKECQSSLRSRNTPVETLLAGRLSYLLRITTNDWYWACYVTSSHRVPQELKPAHFGTVGGTAGSRALPKTCETSQNLCVLLKILPRHSQPQRPVVLRVI